MIKWIDLGLLVLFVLGIAVGVYIIILVKNLNSSIKVVKKLLKDNEENINKTLIDIPIISKNMVEITDTAKNELLVMGNAINSINETIEMTTATVSSIKNDIFGKISGIIGIIDVIKHIFFKDKDEKVG
jgi:predicted PurR-regulated permease PerM